MNFNLLTGLNWSMQSLLLIVWFKHILFRKISMYNIYCDNINTLGYKRKQNAYIVLLLIVDADSLNAKTLVFVKK